MQPKTVQIFSLLLILLLIATACAPGRLLRRQRAQANAAEATAAPLPAEPVDESQPALTDNGAFESPPASAPEPAPPESPLPEPTPTSPPAPTEPPPAEERQGTEINWADAAGQPHVDQNREAGYFIWTDGHRVHIRVTTRGQSRIFSGRASGNGAILRVERVAQEKIDITLREEINQMDFSWVNSGGVDGLDFSFSGTVLRLGLLVDGNPAPKFVFVGSSKRPLDNGLPLRLVR